ncbi:MAG: hypothetical protein KH354_00440 [Clostridiales bacterium]|nr:hypothetical protein [Clostridiales bacterium]
MKKENWWLLASVIWFFNAGCWITVLCVDCCCGAVFQWQMILHAVTALASLLAAVTNFMRYKKLKDNDAEDDGR